METSCLLPGGSSLTTVTKRSCTYQTCEPDTASPPLSASNNDSPFPTTTIRPQRRFRSGLLRHKWGAGSCVLLLVLVALVHPLLPTPQEREWAEHYYSNDGLRLMYSYLPGATLGLRQAQALADAARQELLDDDTNESLSSNGNNLRRLKHHDDDQPKDAKKKKNDKEHHAVPKVDWTNPHVVDVPFPPPSRHKSLQPGCETTVLLIRHCEKGGVAEHCAYQGYERSVYLASLFGTRWPQPKLIYAESPGGRHNARKMNFREIETVGPLAQQFNLTVDDSYNDAHVHGMTKTILHQIKEGHLCGKLVVVAWKHSSIPHIAQHLGCGPSEGCPLDYKGRTFDDVWELTLAYRPWEHSTNKHKFLVQLPRSYWKVFGSVQHENFDPLQVSHAFGDYPVGGTATGGRWQTDTVAYPERKQVGDKAGWQATRLRFPHEQP